MGQIHRSHHLVGQALQPTRPRDLHFLPRNLNKEGMEATQAISNKAMDFTGARLVANILVLAELEAIRQLVKVTRTANMEATKLSGATIMAIASNVADGEATMDTN